MRASIRKKILFFAAVFGSLLSFSQECNIQKIEKGWTFKQVRGNNWYPATIPGVVHTDLIDNGIIEDPFFELNERSVQWVDKEDWEYKNNIVVTDQIFAKQNIELVFEGLDTYADIYLNDSLILKADNMFREWRINIKGILKKDNNELRVYFHSPIKTDIPKFDALDFRYESGNDQSENGGIFDKRVGIFARKAGYHYGWDWGPRLVTSGIWKPVYLQGWDNLKIDNVQYVQKVVTEKQVEMKVITEVNVATAGIVKLAVKSQDAAGEWTNEVPVIKGLNKIEVPVTVKNPKLWWCNGLGKANLYSFTVVATMGDEIVSKTENIGFRSIKVIRGKDKFGTTYCIELNGINVFMKGANFVPQHSFLTEVTDSMYEKTILDAVNANMNMLRVWGGGIYEKDIFYDLCDRYGILVWQDFMFACSLYPTDEAMLKNVEQEAIDNVIRLRNHPSIALWCGNNECQAAWFGWGYQKKYEKLGKEIENKVWQEFYNCYFITLPEVVKKYDNRYYAPSSPYNGDPYSKPETGLAEWNPNGDGHYWGIWHGRDSIENYNNVRCRFFSEYGFQSFPEYQSILRFAPQTKDHNIFSDVMMSHQRGGQNANELIEWYMLNEYKKPKDFESTLYLSQILQGDAIKTAIEAHRRDMPYCMGSLFWQHNDCWPAASWSSRDFYGRWKAQHYFAKKAFRNIIISPIAKDGKLNIFCISDSLKNVKGTLTVNIMNFEGKKVFSQKKNITIKANSSNIYFCEDIQTMLKETPKTEVFVNAEFVETGQKDTISNNYFFTRQKNIDFPQTNIKWTSTATDGGFWVKLESRVFARGVFLSINDVDNFFSDNYFDILPNKTTFVFVKTKLSKSDFDKQLKIMSLYDAF